MHKPNSPVSGLCAYIGHVLSTLVNVYFELEKENGEQGFEILPLKTGLDYMWSWWFLLFLLLPFLLPLSLSFFKEYHATYSFPLILTFVFCLEVIEQAHKKDLKGGVWGLISLSLFPRQITSLHPSEESHSLPCAWGFQNSFYSEWSEWGMAYVLVYHIEAIYSGEMQFRWMKRATRGK